MADLSGLNLLRNDPEVAARLIAAAEEGDMDAQYAAGLVYAEGRGVEPDLVQSYFWLTRAMEQGDVEAIKAATERLEKASHRLAEVMYKSDASTADPHAAADQAGPGAGQDDVIDAEVVDEGKVG